VNADAPPSAPPADSIAPALFVWLLIQLFGLALAAARVQLSAHFPRPAESLAIDEMLVVQIAAAGMLFPWLLRSRARAIAVVLTAGPMLQLAATLASMPGSLVMLLWAYVACWCVPLAAWRFVLGRRFALLGVAVANLLTLGGAAMWYLRAEFSHNAPLPAGVFGIITSAIQIAHADHPSPQPCMFLITVTAVGVIAGGAKWRTTPPNLSTIDPHCVR